MAEVYASLIIKGVKTIDNVPEVIRNDVRQVLTDLGYPELAGDENAVQNQAFHIKNYTRKGGRTNGRSLCDSHY